MLGRCMCLNCSCWSWRPCPTSRLHVLSPSSTAVLLARPSILPPPSLLPTPQGGAAEDGGGVDAEDVRADRRLQARRRHHGWVGVASGWLVGGGWPAGHLWRSVVPNTQDPVVAASSLHLSMIVLPVLLLFQALALCADSVSTCLPLLAEKGLSDLAAHYLMKAGISAIRRLRKTDNNRIARACGATIVSRPGAREGGWTRGLEWEKRGRGTQGWKRRDLPPLTCRLLVLPACRRDPRGRHRHGGGAV